MEIVEFGPPITKIFDSFCCWLGQTLYFHHNGEILHGEVFSSVLLRESFFAQEFQSLLDRLPGIADIRANSHSLHEQFFYRYNAMEGALFAIVQFGNPQFFFVIMAMSKEKTPTVSTGLESWSRSGLIGPEPRR